MQIWTLTHPEHGRMVVTDIRDVERNIGFGWKLLGHETPKEQVIESEPAGEPVADQPKRRGRPPKVKDEHGAAGN